MSQQITDWVAQELATAEEFYVPVKKLWVELLRRAEMPRLSLEEFTRLLEHDERFEFEEGIDFGEGFPAERQEEERANMEDLGFYSGPRAKLKDREITREDLERILQCHTDNLLTALRGAWETRPPSDQEAEDQLLDLLALAQRLQRETLEAIRGEDADLTGLQDPSSLKTA
jgi:hypothetical protein